MNKYIYTKSKNNLLNWNYKKKFEVINREKLGRGYKYLPEDQIQKMIQFET